MLGTLHAERVQIEETEDGFVLHIRTEEIGTVRVNVQDVAVSLEAEVRRELRPYVLEAEHVLASVSDQGYDTGYAPDDPKHPTYHDRMSIAADWKADQVRHLLRGDA